LSHWAFESSFIAKLILKSSAADTNTRYGLTGKRMMHAAHQGKEDSKGRGCEHCEFGVY